MQQHPRCSRRACGCNARSARRQWRPETQSRQTNAGERWPALLLTLCVGLLLLSMRSLSSRRHGGARFQPVVVRPRPPFLVLAAGATIATAGAAPHTSTPLPALCRTAAPPARGPDGLGSSLADPDLAYLNIGDERDSAEKEYMKQDSEHMEALEQAYGRLREQNRAMEQQLKVGAWWSV